MIQFLMSNHLLGLVIGLSTFLIIGLFHPIVIKAQYHFGRGCWWVFLLLGIVFLGISILLSDIFLSTVSGVIAFSCFWSILEVFQQEKRVERGWFPANPKRQKKASK